MTIKNVLTTGVASLAVAGLLLAGVVTTQAQVTRATSTSLTAKTSTSTSLYWGAPQSSETAELQKELQELGYYSGAADGNFGKSTYEAVRAFQSANNLKVDGVAGATTIQAVYSSTATAASTTKPPVTIATKVPVVTPVVAPVTKVPTDPTPIIVPTGPTKIPQGTLVLPNCEIKDVELESSNVMISTGDEVDVQWEIDDNNIQYCEDLFDDSDVGIHLVPVGVTNHVINAIAVAHPSNSALDDEYIEIDYNGGIGNGLYYVKVFAVDEPSYFALSTDTVQIGGGANPAGCSISNIEIENSSNGYRPMFQQLLNLGFTSQQAIQLLPMLTAMDEQFNVGDELDISWDAVGTDCDDDADVKLVGYFFNGSGAPVSYLDAQSNYELDDEEFEGDIQPLQTGFYVANVDGHTVVSDDMIYINGSSSSGTDPHCLEISPNSSPSPQIATIPVTQYQVAEFTIENVCDEEVEFESFDFSVISSYGIAQFDDIEAELGNDDLSDVVDISISYNNSIGGNAMTFSIDGDNIELDAGDDIDLQIRADVWGAYSPWVGSEFHSTAFAVSLDDVDYEYESDSFGWNERPVWDNLIVVHYDD